MLLSNEYLDLFKAAAVPNLRILPLLWGQYSGYEGTLGLKIVRGQGDHTLWFA